MKLHTENPWKVLIVDDDAQIHSLTCVALEDVEFQGRPIRFISAYSESETKDILKNHDDIALILLDVVMENEDSGLRLTKYIRNTLKNNVSRIILRSGMLSYEAHRQLIVDFDIDDFREKADLSPAKLFSACYSSLRTYAGIKEIQAKEQLAQEQQRKLLQADKMIALGTLVSGVAHEVNNPNNLIVFNAAILKRFMQDAIPILRKHAADNKDFKLSGLPFDEVEDQMTSLIEGIHQGADRIKNIISDLKEFSRDRSTLIKETFDIHEAASMAIKLVRHQISRSTGNFIEEYEEDLPLVKGNSQKIEQVIINLLINACQSLESHNQSIHLKVYESTDNNTVVVSIKDEGTGISEKDLSQIFDPFFTTRRDQKGTGLGLAISREIVKDHGGELKLTSTFGEGSLATIELPIYNDEENDNDEENGSV